MKAYKAIVTLLLTAVVTTAYAGNANPVTDTGALDADAVELPTNRPEEVVVKQFAGSGDDRTLGFSVDGSWAIRWRAEPMTQFEGLGGFRAELYDVATNELLGSIGENVRRGSGVERIPLDGRFYLKIASTNVRWEVDIVDLEDHWAAAGYGERADSNGRLVLAEDPRTLETVRSAAIDGQ